VAFLDFHLDLAVLRLAYEHVSLLHLNNPGAMLLGHFWLPPGSCYAFDLRTGFLTQ
jgi:hypothetical protein